MRLAVIGGNAAGMSAAARARRLDRSLEIVVLEKTPHVSWGSCGLPYYVEGQVPRLSSLVVHPAEYYRGERNIDVRTGAEVAAIQHSRRQVALAGGERVAYDKLVIATGARPDTRGLPLSEHCLTLATMDDAERLRTRLRTRPPKRAAVIGAGYIGLELVGALRAHGVEVVLYDAHPELLGRRDAALTDLITAHLQRCRVELRLGERVQDPCALGVDLVLLATGFRPNVELVQDAGIELGRSGAIRTDERLETNLSGVFAAGDCAEVNHLVTRRPVYLPLGTTANKMGRIAGANAAGRRERFPGVAGTTIVRAAGLAVAVTGLSEAQARREGIDAVSANVVARGRTRYFLGCNISVGLTAERRTGRVLGGWVSGEEGTAGRINVIATAVTGRMTLEDFQQLDLAYAPPYATVWDPLLIAAQQLAKRV